MKVLALKVQMHTFQSMLLLHAEDVDADMNERQKKERGGSYVMGSSDNAGRNLGKDLVVEAADLQKDLEKRVFENFWLRRPRLLLIIAHFVFCINSLAMAVFIYFLWFESDVITYPLWLSLPFLFLDLMIMLYSGFVVVPIYGLLVTSVVGLDTIRVVELNDHFEFVFESDVIDSPPWLSLPCLFLDLVIMLYIGFVMVPIYGLLVTSVVNDPHTMYQGIKMKKRAEEMHVDPGMFMHVLDGFKYLMHKCGCTAGPAKKQKVSKATARVQAMFIQALAGQAGVVMASDNEQSDQVSNLADVPFKQALAGQAGLVMAGDYEQSDQVSNLADVPFKRILRIWKVRTLMPSHKSDHLVQACAKRLNFDNRGLRVLQEAFETLDVDQSGSITTDELFELLHGIGTHATPSELRSMLEEGIGTRATPSELRSMLEEVDDDGDNTITFREFFLFLAFAYLTEPGTSRITPASLYDSAARQGISDEQIIKDHGMPILVPITEEEACVALVEVVTTESTIAIKLGSEKVDLNCPLVSFRRSGDGRLSQASRLKPTAGTNLKLPGSAIGGGDWSALEGGDRSALEGGDRSALEGDDRSALEGGDRAVIQAIPSVAVGTGVGDGEGPGGEGGSKEGLKTSAQIQIQIHPSPTEEAAGPPNGSQVNSGPPKGGHTNSGPPKGGQANSGQPNGGQVYSDSVCSTSSLENAEGSNLEPFFVRDSTLEGHSIHSEGHSIHSNPLVLSKAVTYRKDVSYFLGQINPLLSTGQNSSRQYNSGQYNHGQINPLLSTGQNNSGQYDSGQYYHGQSNYGQNNHGQYNSGQNNYGQYNHGQNNHGQYKSLIEENRRKPQAPKSGWFSSVHNNPIASDDISDFFHDMGEGGPSERNTGARAGRMWPGPLAEGRETVVAPLLSASGENAEGGRHWYQGRSGPGPESRETVVAPLSSASGENAGGGRHRYQGKSGPGPESRETVVAPLPSTTKEHAGGRHWHQARNGPGTERRETLLAPATATLEGRYLDGSTDWFLAGCRPGPIAEGQEMMLSAVPLTMEGESLGGCSHVGPGPVAEGNEGRESSRDPVPASVSFAKANKLSVALSSEPEATAARANSNARKPEVPASAAEGAVARANTNARKPEVPASVAQGAGAIATSFMLNSKAEAAKKEGAAARANSNAPKPEVPEGAAARAVSFVLKSKASAAKEEAMLNALMGGAERPAGSGVQGRSGNQLVSTVNGSKYGSDGESGNPLFSAMNGSKSGASGESGKPMPSDMNGSKYSSNGESGNPLFSAMNGSRSGASGDSGKPMPSDINGSKYGSNGEAGNPLFSAMNGSKSNASGESGKPMPRDINGSKYGSNGEASNPLFSAMNGSKSDASGESGKPMPSIMNGSKYGVQGEPGNPTTSTMSASKLRDNGPELILGGAQVPAKAVVERGRKNWGVAKAVMAATTIQNNTLERKAAFIDYLTKRDCQLMVDYTDVGGDGMVGIKEFFRVFDGIVVEGAGLLSRGPTRASDV
eukprot:gene20247-26999_t